MAGELEGRIAVVTGAASGIGAACATALAAGGATVVVTDIDGAAAEQTASQLGATGYSASSRELNVAREASVDEVFANVVSEFGRLDIAVNNAGISVAPASVADQSTEDWRRVMSVNLDGVFFCMRSELRAMRPLGGVITNVGSVLSVVASRSGSSAYVASKHAVVGLTKSAAVSHAHDGIRVNVVGPGYVETSMTRATLGSDVLEQRAAQHPIGRLGRPDEIGELVAWLSTDSASFVTGAYVPADGGYTAI